MTPNLTPELATPTATLLREIADPRLKRKDVARTYALALVSTEVTNWHQVHDAIVERWSWSGLEWIKREAWKIHDAKENAR